MGASSPWWNCPSATKLTDMFKRKRKKRESQLFNQIREAYRVTKSVRPWIGAALLAIFVASMVVATLIINSIFSSVGYSIFVATPVSILMTMLVFTRLAASAAYAAIEGQLGAGASVLMAIRKGYVTTAAVSVNRNQDMVHRSVGRAGIVLVGEGGQAVRQLIADEKKKSERYAPGVPIHEVIVGDGDGQVPLRKLQKHLKKLPKKLTKHQLRELRARLKAVGGLSLPLPKGPMPKSARLPKMR